MTTVNNMLRPYLFAGLLGISFGAGQVLIYEPFVVPQLSSWQAVPNYIWFVSVLPEVLVTVGATLSLHRLWDATVFCLTGSLVITTIQFLFGIFQRPAHHKVIEGGLMHFGLQFFIVTALLASLIGATSLCNWVFHRVRT